MRSSTRPIQLSCFAVCSAVLALVFLLGSQSSSQERRARAPLAGTGEEHTMTHDGKERVYRLHVPEGLPKVEKVPLVVVFHGGGGNARQGSRIGFTAKADKEKFIAVYPEALNGNWNDGRTGELIRERAGENDDVGFIMALIKKLRADHKIDPEKIFATGFSNGGMMSHRMAIEHADTFAAIAPGIGGVAVEIATEEKFKPSEPVSVMILQGTDDALVPYDGGKIVARGIPALGIRAKDRGAIVSTDRALELWTSANGIEGKPAKTKLPDRDPNDGCTLERYDYPKGKNDSRVVLVKMIGAGHTIPGGVQYLPERVIGKTCRDADAVELIWDFFSETQKEE